MKDFSETSALSIIYSNTKRKKRKVDLVTLAEAVNFILDEYNDKQKVAKTIGVSQEMIRQLLLPLKMPEEIKILISQRKIDSIDLILHLSTIKDRELQRKAARLLTNFPTKDSRDIIRTIRQSNIDIENAIDNVIELKSGSLHAVLLDISESDYRLLKKASEELHLPPAIIVKGILLTWLSSFKKEN